MKQIHKYITLVEYVDLETGEVVTKSNFIRNYYKIRSKKTTEIKEVIIKNEKLNYCYVKYITEIRRNKQIRLF